MRRRPDLERNSQCPECGEYFHRLGIMRHRAMHRDERDRARKARSPKQGSQK